MSERQPVRLAMVACGALKQQHHLTTLCQYLVTQGIELEFISVQAAESEVAWFGGQVRGMKTHALGHWGGKGLGRFIRGGLALRVKLSKLRFDILYVVDSWPLRYLAVATLGRMRWRRLPLVYHTFNMLVPHVAAWVEILLERHAARRSQLNVNVDRTKAMIAQALFGLRERPIDVPLRLLRTASLPAAGSKLRARCCNVAEDVQSFLVVNPTRLTSERLGKEIIRGFAKLPANYHLVTVNGAGTYAKECLDLVAREGLRDRVHILEPMPHEELLEICADADVGLIFHNTTSSLGNYIAHPGRLAYFLALGLPVVATDVPVMEAVVYRHGLGFCCSPFSPEGIADSIVRICDGDIALPVRRKQIREAFESELHFEKKAPRLVEALQDLALQI